MRITDLGFERGVLHIDGSLVTYVTFLVDGKGVSKVIPHFGGYPRLGNPPKFKVNSECPPLTQEEIDFLKAYHRLVS